MSKVNLKFHFPKSNVEKINDKLIKKYTQVITRFANALRQKQPNIRTVKLKDGKIGRLVVERVDSPKHYNFIITNTKPYASYFETGTGVYGPTGKVITPKYKKLYMDNDVPVIRLPYALHWISGGNHFFAKYVRGMQKTKPFTQTLFTEFKRIFIEVMKNA